MIATWLVFAMIVATILALAARGMEAVCRRLAVPTRWVWIGALALTVGVVLLAPFRSQAGDIGGMTPGRTHDGMAALRSAFTVPVAAAAAAIARDAPGMMSHWLAVAWITTSSGLFTLVLLVHHRVRRISRGLPFARLHGMSVRLSPTGGPMVTGLVLPEIVVPQWLLGRTAEEQRLVLAHESQHVQARDPLLLALGWLAAVLLPSIPAVWWMLSRLRLAVEVDCDQRVLGGGRADVRSYGDLLIALQGEPSGLRMPVPGLTARPSHLHHRLLAMTTHQAPQPLLRSFPLALLAGLALVVACDARLPTAIDPPGIEEVALLAGRSIPTRHQVGELVTGVIDSTVSVVMTRVLGGRGLRVGLPDPDSH
jgi:beta-lactamase regulating signal transducer with metallopeptidase domain